MGSAALGFVASGRLLVGVTLGVVVAFVTSTLISVRIENRSARDTDDIIGNAMPSVQVLSLVRGDLHAIERYLRDRDQLSAHELARSILTQRRNIDAALASYEALPFFPGEPEFFEPIPGLLQRLDAQLPHASPTSTDAEVDAFDETIDEIDHCVERIESFDASQGQRLGLAIARTRSDSRSLKILLDTVTAVLALIALTLAVLRRRRAFRVLMDETTTAEQSLADLRTQVDELGHFTGRIAHDIRNPLQTALLFLEIVRQTHPDAEAAVENSTSALKEMNGLVEDLLAFARAGGKPVPGATTDMEAVVREVVHHLASEAAAAKVELAVDAPTSARVSCATGVITSIVSNLTRNAIAHMGDAALRKVSVRITDAGSRWRLEVQDTGPGIPPGEERRIFEPYVQLDRKSGGIGLGLATVDRFVRAHGGQIGVSSPRDGGALFWVELPKDAHPALALSA